MTTYDFITKDKKHLFSCDSDNESRNFIGDYLESHPSEMIIQINNRKHPAPAFPYTAWTKVLNKYRGSMYATIEQALNHGERG